MDKPSNVNNQLKETKINTVILGDDGKDETSQTRLMIQINMASFDAYNRSQLSHAICIVDLGSNDLDSNIGLLSITTGQHEVGKKRMVQGADLILIPGCQAGKSINKWKTFAREHNKDAQIVVIGKNTYENNREVAYEAIEVMTACAKSVRQQREEKQANKAHERELALQSRYLQAMAPHYDNKWFKTSEKDKLFAETKNSIADGNLFNKKEFHTRIRELCQYSSSILTSKEDKIKGSDTAKLLVNALNEPTNRDLAEYLGIQHPVNISDVTHKDSTSIQKDNRDVPSSVSNPLTFFHDQARVPNAGENDFTMDENPNTYGNAL